MPFKISHWCGIPHKFIRHADGSLARERFHEMKEAGIDLMASYDYGYETNCEMLSLCGEISMRVTLSDARIGEAIRSPEKRRELLRDVVSDYSRFPALDGYHIIDEPNASQFESLADVVSILRELDPEHESYINLFPNYATPAQLGNTSYCEHIFEFADTVKPSILSFDHYHFMKSRKPPKNLPDDERERMIIESAFSRNERPGFFDNLEEIRKCSISCGIPFMIIVLVTEHGPYRNLSEAEIRFEVFQSTAYGSSRISYFTYWTPGVDTDEGDDRWHWQNGMIAKDGTRNPHYFDVQRINRELANIGNAIEGRKNLEVFHIGGEADKLIREFHPFGGITAVFASHLTLGFFDEGYVILANKDYENTSNVSFAVDADKSVVLFDKFKADWLPLAKKDGKYTLTLLPGDGELLKIT